MRERVADCFADANAACAVGIRAAHLFAQSSGGLVIRRRDPATGVDSQPRDCVVDADASERLRFHEQRGGMHDDRIE